MKRNENWKTVVRDTNNLRDVFNAFLDDVEVLSDFYEQESNKEMDDATWVHVDVAQEERRELEERIESLNKSIDILTEEYNTLASKYKQLLKSKEAPKEESKNEKPTRAVPKRKSRLPKKALKPKGFEALEDDIPF